MKKYIVIALVHLFFSNYLFSQKLESVTWEDLFSVYRADGSLKINVISGLGFDPKGDYKIPKSNLNCHEFSILLGTELQGMWYETITICDSSRQVIYSTENSTFFLELRAKLINEYGFTDGGYIKTGSQLFINDSSTIEIKSTPGLPPDGFSKHVIKIKKIPLESALATVIAPPLERPKAEFHALIIGINKYKGISNRLKKPSKDAIELDSILVKYWGFPRENMIVLTDSVSRDDIIKGLESFSTLRKDDNLLIFFAGHGHTEGQGVAMEGYWDTSTKTPGSHTGSISNSELISNLKQIHAGHILVFTDACFGGSMLIKQYLGNLNTIKKSFDQSYGRFSRELISSVGLDETPDNSLFFEETKKILNDKSIKMLTAKDLFIEVCGKLENSNAVFGSLELPEANSGNFVFMKP